MTEQRQVARVRSMLGAQIVFNNRSTTIDCSIRNVSPRGAKLLVGETMSIPQEFELSVPAKGRSYRATIIWRRAGEVGVEFAQEPSRATLMMDDSERVRELESENALLRKRIVDLKSQLERFMQTDA
ncbi:MULTISPECIES: PilZ domain-containing protein [unclassified Beijerinckia]|uniref:PilZ domain-containing protein n=1 Tax=unclassified Beijerinckia TaxID=2638183 RepID=UPI00089914DF|nr:MULTISPECIES: PilZ domain-containing protein [unclassified Beijerinckia]MDH7798383.1 hypothetical protein [Beijerinckia sp. GAS462]SED19071.1 PilZ domain-containing protein [Beijerinckia sp. 28-YEA-48]